MAYQGISWQLAGRVLVVTIDRELQRNAIDTHTMNELTNVFTRADQDDEVRVVVVTGRGRNFCAGGDLSAGDTTFDAVASGRGSSAEEHVETGGPMAMSLFANRKPFIAAINGPAVGIGLTMTLPMDIRLSVPGCKLALTFARRGIVPDACSSWFLSRIVGLGNALDWACSGRTFLSEEALNAGLLHEICSPDALIPRAMEIAQAYVDHAAPVAVATTRQLFMRMASAAHPLDAYKIEAQAIFELGQSADAREGVRAFLDKRNPDFPLRVSANMPTCFPWWPESEAINRNVGGPATGFAKSEWASNPTG